MTRCAIVGTGISGLSVGYFLTKQLPDLELTFYERNLQPGGVIRTEHIDGCVVDGGPDSFLTQKTSAAKLCTELGLETDLTGSNDAERKTFIYHDGKLKELPGGMFLMVPTSPLKFLSSDLISWPGKFSAINDLFALPETVDCTVADWIERRFGVEIMDTIAEPLISGIYGADIRKLSLKSALPQMWELQKNGSTIRKMMKRKSEAAAPLFTTLSHGMQSLIDALHLLLITTEWKFDSEIKRIDYDGSWIINDSKYDALILSASSFPVINTSNGSEIKSVLDSIHRNQAIVVALGFKDMRRDGFGWLIPRADRRSVLACTYVSNKFPGRTPPDYFLTRVFIGGSHAANWIDRSDDEITEEVQSELHRIAKITETPEFIRIFRWRSAMPEYAVGHSDKIAHVMNLVQSERNLFVTGNIFQGVGIPDCIQHAQQTATNVVQALGQA